MLALCTFDFLPFFVPSFFAGKDKSRYFQEIANEEEEEEETGAKEKSIHHTEKRAEGKEGGRREKAE